MRASKILPILISVLWLATMAMLLQRHYSHVEPPSPAAAASAETWMHEPQWMGIYQRDSKIGYSVSELQQVPGGYRAKGRVHMKINVMGVEKEIETVTEARMDSSYRLESFVFELDSDVSMRTEGVLEGNVLSLSIETGGMKAQKKLHMAEKPYLDVSLTPLLKDLLPGGKLKLPMMELASLTEDTIELEALGRAKVTVMGLRQEAMKLKGNYKGAEITMWVKEDGQVLKHESMGFTFIKESQDEAVALGNASIDLIADMAVPSDVKLEPGLRYLKVRLSGIDLQGLELDGGVQRQEGDIVEISIENLASKKLSASGAEAYLGETLFVQANDPRIVSLANEIAGGYNDPRGKARSLFDWVFLNIKKVPTMTIPSALEVLESRRGDCNEHTTLYTALARAAGIPTRIAIGLVYRDGYFYYHAWPEVYLDGWVPIDPTLGQYPADATHIRLLTGGLENQLRLGPVFGNLKIKALHYR